MSGGVGATAAGGTGTAATLGGGGVGANGSWLIWCFSGVGVAAFVWAGVSADGVLACATISDIDCVSSASLAGSVAPP